MLIELHVHQFTPGMMNLDPHWGPKWDREHQTLRVGDWYLATKRLSALASAGSTERSEALLQNRMGHEFRRELMAKLGVDVLVLSAVPHMYMYWAGEFQLRFARTCNDELAAYCEKDPEHFLFWATLPMAYPDEAVKELERAVSELGAVGFSCGGRNFGGRELHDKAYDPLWAKVSELDVPIFIHAYNQSVAWGERAMEDSFESTSVTGFCYDEAQAFWNLINGGVLDRFPTLRFYITHGGGFIPYQLGRLEILNETLAPDSENEKPFREYMKNFYFDPLVHSAAMRRGIVEDIGVEQLVYGGNFMGSDSVDFDLTGGIGLSDADRERIRSGNAIKLLKLESRLTVNS